MKKLFEAVKVQLKKLDWTQLSTYLMVLAVIIGALGFATGVVSVIIASFPALAGVGSSIVGFLSALMSAFVGVYMLIHKFTIDTDEDGIPDAIEPYIPDLPEAGESPQSDEK